MGTRGTRRKEKKQDKNLQIKIIKRFRRILMKMGGNWVDNNNESTVTIVAL